MKPIVISLSPNVFGTDIALALRVLLQPWRWMRGPETEALEAKLAARVGGEVVTFDSGRVAWFALLQAFGIGAGDEVLLQAPTCIVVPNSIRWCGATPVYVDCDPRTLNIDPVDLERKITARTRMIVVQHTFGIPAEMAAIQRIARAHNLLLVEDGAHALGGTTPDAEGTAQPLGGVGDAAFFSFGRDKVISSVYGGAAVARDPAVAQKLRAVQQSLAYPSVGWVVQQLLHPLLTAIILPIYGTKIGKGLLVLLQKIRLLSKAVYASERRGKRHPSMPRRLPTALAILALHQLSRLDAFNTRRRAIAARYQAALTDPRIVHPIVQAADTPVFLRYTIQVPEVQRLLRLARRYDVYLGDWYTGVLAPAGSDLSVAGYIAGSCPAAEQVTQQMVNLPTHPTLSDADVTRVIELVNHHMQELHGN